MSTCYIQFVIAQSHGNNNHTASLSSLHTSFPLTYYCICITWIALEYLHNMFTSWVDSMTTTYNRYVRDFAFLISTVMFSTLASVRVLLSRLSRRGNKTLFWLQTIAECINALYKSRDCTVGNGALGLCVPGMNIACKVVHNTWCWDKNATKLKLPQCRPCCTYSVLQLLHLCTCIHSVNWCVTTIASALHC